MTAKTTNITTTLATGTRSALACAFLLSTPFLAATAVASSLNVSLSCHDSGLGGGLFPRAYDCLATASGGEPPYDFEWLGAINDFQINDSQSIGIYNVDGCFGTMTASGTVIVRDDATNQVLETASVTLNC